MVLGDTCLLIFTWHGMSANGRDFDDHIDLGPKQQHDSRDVEPSQEHHDSAQGTVGFCIAGKEMEVKAQQ